MVSDVLRRAVFVAATLTLFVAPFGCTTAPPRLGAWDDSFVYGGTRDQRERAREAMNWLEEPVQRAVRSIQITNDCPDYKPRDKDGNWREAAHTHPGTRDICVRPSYVSHGNVWHESGHALMMTQSAEEQERLTRISMNAYGDMEGDFPRNGILTWYGATNPWEDFAEWVRWAMCRLHDEPMGSIFVDMRVIDVTDPSYLKHLEVLRDWGAISQAQYDELEPLFTLRVNGVPVK
ncbi:MAG: hypothetical protein Q7R85_00825 [bacterium]|nr:hypothetical protein [bacterium]